MEYRVFLLPLKNEQLQCLNCILCSMNGNIQSHICAEMSPFFRETIKPLEMEDDVISHC